MFGVGVLPKPKSVHCNMLISSILQWCSVVDRWPDPWEHCLATDAQQAHFVNPIYKIYIVFRNVTFVFFFCLLLQLNIHYATWLLYRKGHLSAKWPWLSWYQSCNCFLPNTSLYGIKAWIRPLIIFLLGGKLLSNLEHPKGL